MGSIKSIQPVKLFIGVLSTSNEMMEKAQKILVKKYGVIDKESTCWDFTFTNYYEKEMGASLLRKFFSFELLIQPDELIDIKIHTNEIETNFSEQYAPPERPINLDPGYLCLSKIILATTKDYTHRIYLGKGIYAECTLGFYNKKFHPWSWTYPDYKSEFYLDYFHEVRNTYRQQLRSGIFSKNIIQ